MQQTSWTNKIAIWNYTMANTKTYENYSSSNVYGPIYWYNTNQAIYLNELNRGSKSSQTCYFNSSTTANCSVGEWKNLSAKISLMYASDYALSLGSSALNYKSSSNDSTVKTGWMYINNNDNFATEWTMSRRGSGGDDYHAHIVNSITGIGYVSLNNSHYVRPVFYLEKTIELNGGTGTASDPYLIKQ